MAQNWITTFVLQFRQSNITYEKYVNSGGGGAPFDDSLFDYFLSNRSRYLHWRLQPESLPVLGDELLRKNWEFD
jgi:hypothetical protein